MVESPKPVTEELEGSVRSMTSLESLGTCYGESVVIVGEKGGLVVVMIHTASSKPYENPLDGSLANSGLLMGISRGVTWSCCLLRRRHIGLAHTKAQLCQYPGSKQGNVSILGSDTRL